MIFLHIWCRILRILLFLKEMSVINFIPKCQHYIINYGCLFTVLFSDQLMKDILIFFVFLYHNLNLYLNSWFDFLLYDFFEYLFQIYRKVVLLIINVLFLCCCILWLVFILSYFVLRIWDCLFFCFEAVLTG